MGTRFVILSLLTSIFQIICAITLLVGIVMIANGLDSSEHSMAISNNPFGAVSSNPFAQVPAAMMVGGGAVLFLYGLTGLVFSGAVSVLISIDQDIHSLCRDVPAAVLALQKAVMASVRVSPLEPLSAEPAKPIPTVMDVAADTKECAGCKSPNDITARFCEYCGDVVG